jgi:hypothetical protein
MKPPSCAIARSLGGALKFQDRRRWILDNHAAAILSYYRREKLLRTTKAARTTIAIPAFAPAERCSALRRAVPAPIHAYKNDRTDLAM